MKIGSLVGVSLLTLCGLCSGCPPGFFPVGFRLLGIFFLNGRAEDGRDEFSKFVLSLFLSILFEPFNIDTSASACSALFMRTLLL